MTFTEIRNTVISRMTAQTIIDGKDVLYPNAPTFDPSGKLIWARLSNIPGQAGVNEIGAGPIVYRTGIIIIQLFVPAGSGSKLITETADKLRELFEFQDDDRLSYQAVSSTSQTTADRITAHNLRIITSRFSAIKKAPFLAPVSGL
ncbi:phage tail terminator-like protein [Escherichia coli]|uniref:phage tail terminator-like protein n=4 Tax=Escherichia coli TaxID=562 RepID=UPI0001FB84F4|nr:phage tail terminator-like protein [Escherichia coli]EGB58008.1 hypothetical protein ERGG_01127 [Escherichia coli H489]